MDEPGARGCFGGALDCVAGVTEERIPSPLRDALAAAMGPPRALPVISDPEAAPLVPLRLDGDGVLRAPGDLRETRAWSAAALPRPAAMRALARVARSLHALHAQGVVHGDLRPETVRVDARGGVGLVVPAHATAPGALLAARLHPGGAHASEVGFAAPEVVLGAGCTAESDVYALAALAHLTLTGAPPFGQLGRHRFPHAGTVDGAIANALDAALAQHPAQRPTLAQLSGALSDDADALARGAFAGPTALSAAPSGVDPARPTALSPGLVFVLVVGAVCAFFGAVLLVSAGWGVVGEVGRVAMLAALTAVCLGLGQLAAWRGLATGASVARGLGGLFATVAVGYAYYLLNEPGRLGLITGLGALALAGGALASSRGAPNAGVALLALGSQLGWAIGAQAIHLGRPDDRRAAYALVAGAVSAVTWALAARRRSLLLAVLGALDLAAFAGVFGVWLDRGEVMGLAVYTLGTAAVYLLLARLATAKDDVPAVPYAGGAVVAAGVSALAGLHVLADRWETHGLVGGAWPYAVAVAAVAASPMKHPAGGAARFVALATVALAPTLEAVIRPELGFTALAVALGLASLLAASLATALRPRGQARTELVLIAVFGALAAPSLRALRAIDRVGADPDAGSRGAWIALSATAIALLTASYGLTARLHRGQRRAVESSALGALLALATLRSLADTRDLGVAAMALGASALAALLGGLTRRAAVMLGGATGLLVNVWIQYFARLADLLPLSVRLVGFGVGLLLGGVIYEQSLRHRAAALREWE